MRIIDSCANWQALVAAYPSFKCLRSNPSRIFAEGSLKALYPALNSTELATVMALFGGTAQDAATLRHDLATLMGVGKGSNHLIEPMTNNFVAKFAQRHVAWMIDPLFTSKMCMCVAQARSLGSRVVNAFSADSARHGLLREAMQYHFLVGPDDGTWNDIRNRMITTRNGLAGSFRLAATAEDSDDVGHVKTKEAAKMSGPPSTNRTWSVDEYDRDLVHGSIHVD